MEGPTKAFRGCTFLVYLLLSSISWKKKLWLRDLMMDSYSPHQNTTKMKNTIFPRFRLVFEISSLKNTVIFLFFLFFYTNSFFFFIRNHGNRRITGSVWRRYLTTDSFRTRQNKSESKNKILNYKFELWNWVYGPWCVSNCLKWAPVGVGNFHF